MNQNTTKNLLLEQSLIKNTFGGFFDFLRDIVKNSRKMANNNYNHFNKESKKEVTGVKQYFKWLNENLPLEEEELYYIPEDDIEPAEFNEKDFISPFVYATNSIKKFGKFFSAKKETWGSEFVTDDAAVFDAILCSMLMESRSNKSIYRKLIENKIDLYDISESIIKQKTLENGAKIAQEFQSILADFFTFMALFAKTIEYIKEAKETARKLDVLFSKDKNLNFLSKDGKDRFKKNMGYCFEFANGLSTTLYPIKDNIFNKLPPEYGNFEMSEEDWIKKSESLPEDFWEIDLKIREQISSLSDEIAEVRENLLRYIDQFRNAFIFSDIEYEIEDYCILEAEICELFLRKKEYEEELREKRAKGDDVGYLVDIINDIEKIISKKESEIKNFKSQYSSMIKETKLIRSYIRKTIKQSIL